MTSLNTFGTIATLIVFGLLTVDTLFRHVHNGKDNIQTITSIHRYLLFSGGLLFGLGIGGQISDPLVIGLLSDQVILSLLFIFAAILLTIFGDVYLQNSIWSPMEQISEFSAEFGTNFISTRLPITGPVEIQGFSRRFNENTMSLSNKISILEIEIEKLVESTEEQILNGNELSTEINNLKDILINYNEITNNQENVVKTIGDKIGDFVKWYEDTQLRLQDNFIELRSLSELGNLIAINAAVEASNLDVPNPGFETIAEKLKDLARSLEERQSDLRRLVDEVNLRYDEFRTEIQSSVSEAVNLSTNTSSLGLQVDEIISKISNKESRFNASSSSLKQQINSFEENIPTAYK